MTLPKLFADQMKDLLGAEWSDFEAALEATATRAVRLHRVALEPQARSNAIADPILAVAADAVPLPTRLRRQLGADVPWTTSAYYVELGSTLGRDIYHEMGAYYLQEPSAMAVVSALDPQPGENVLDLCAAPGGKTTAIGQRLRGQGVLVANEIHPTRVLTLAQNLERTGVPAVVVNESPRRLSAQWDSWFDAVLVDAPCSGEGMFRKDPDSRLAWSVEAVEHCVARQKEILPDALRMIKPGGRLVYSTCTFNPFENEQIIAWLLKNFDVEVIELPCWPGWEPGRPAWADDTPELIHTRRLWPHRGRGEGHFVAAMRVHAKVQSGGYAKRHAQRRPKPNAAWSKWLNTILSVEPPEIWSEPITHRSHIYSSEARDLPMPGLRVLRPGVGLATEEKGRFDPHHQLAMVLRAGTAANAFQVSEQLAGQYLTGQALPPSSEPGWNWVHLGGLPLGWAKSVSGRMNNLYPKGLRKGNLTYE